MKLKKPITFAGEEITEVVLGEVRAEHLWDTNVNKLTVGDLLMIAARISKVPPAAMKMLGGDDAMALVAEVSSFFDGPDSDSPGSGS